MTLPNLNYKLLGFVGIIITIIVIFANLKSCHNNPTVVSDSTKTIYIHDTVRTHTDSTIVQYRDNIVKVRVPFPVLVHDTINPIALNPSDSCSDLSINKIIDRQDGGFVKLVATVSCKGRTFVINELSGSAFQKDTIFRDSATKTIITNQTIIKELKDSIEKIVLRQNDNTLLTLTPFAEYYALGSHGFDVGLVASTELLFKYFSVYGFAEGYLYSSTFGWRAGFGLSKSFNIKF